MTTQLKIMPPPAGDDAADPMVALDREGWAVLPGLLDAAACDGLAALSDAPAGFRSHIPMARHGFGRGEYRYLDRKSVVSGKSVSVRVDLGGRRIIEKNI